jgi:hypothetical protein
MCPGLSSVKTEFGAPIVATGRGSACSERTGKTMRFVRVVDRGGNGREIMER